ncbi:MAG: CBS domain-containing protein [Gemmatimonadaceae bacterium]
MLRLRDIMTTGVITVTPETTLREAMELFAEHHISGMPVMEGTRVVGVVSASDVLAFAATPPDERDWPDDRDLAPGSEDPEWEEAGAGGADEQAGRALAELWMASGGDDEMADDDAGRAAYRDPLGSATVADVMTWGVYALPPASDVAAAAECMRSADVHRMLVIEDGRLLGIVTTMDLVDAVARNRIVRRTFVFDRRPAEGG